MNNLLLALYVKLQGLMSRDEGQDLIEYALLLSMIALLCIAAVSNLGTLVKTIYVNMSSSLA